MLGSGTLTGEDFWEVRWAVPLSFDSFSVSRRGLRHVGPVHLSNHRVGVNVVVQGRAVDHVGQVSEGVGDSRHVAALDSEPQFRGFLVDEAAPEHGSVDVNRRSGADRSTDVLVKLP